MRRVFKDFNCEYVSEKDGMESSKTNCTVASVDTLLIKKVEISCLKIVLNVNCIACKLKELRYNGGRTLFHDRISIIVCFYYNYWKIDESRRNAIGMAKGDQMYCVKHKETRE